MNNAKEKVLLNQLNPIESQKTWYATLFTLPHHIMTIPKVMLTFKKFDGISHMVVPIFDTIYSEGLPDLAVTTLKLYHNGVERIIESIYVCIIYKNQ